MDPSPTAPRPSDEKDVNQEFSQLREDFRRWKEGLAELKASIQAENERAEVLLAALKESRPPPPAPPFAG